ncbi:MAG: ABC transporter substrate-binding protein, partial [Syntrophomonas sp.]
MKRKLMALLLVTFLLSVAGCAGDKQPSTTPTPKDTSIVVTDGLGREVKISGPVKRISTNYGIATHMIFALG